MKFTIGIVPRLQKDTFTTKIFYKSTYLEVLDSYNYNIILLSPISNILQNQLLLCDGFIIPGGNDIDPSLYHQSLNSKTILCDPLESMIEKDVLDYAVNNKKPVLGICKGMQAINVFFGGTLIQDIKNHQDCHHQITANSDQYIVNSYHHQCIDTLAPTFKITHQSLDGIIEGIENIILPIIGVQWHPELDLSSSINRRIFDKFKTLLELYSVLK